MTAGRSASPRIAILGGGIRGLAAEAFLRREGLTATVYEQASQLAEVGAGLVVAPNAARQLRTLGGSRSSVGARSFSRKAGSSGAGRTDSLVGQGPCSLL